MLDPDISADKNIFAGGVNVSEDDLDTFVDGLNVFANGPNISADDAFPFHELGSADLMDGTCEEAFIDANEFAVGEKYMYL